MKKVLVSMRADGGFQMEFDGRTVAFNELATLARVLMSEETRLNEDGAPTQYLADHWEKHAQTRDPRCAICHWLESNSIKKPTNQISLKDLDI